MADPTEHTDNLWQLYREIEAKLQRREDEIERLKSHYENHQALIEDYSRMWRNQDSTITRLRSLAPRLRIHAGRPAMVAEIADELERTAADTQGLREPDWADVREAARNAGWTRRQLARDWWVWTDKDSSVHLRKRWDGGWKITLAGEFGDLVLNQPTPARFLAIARELGIGGTS